MKRLFYLLMIFVCILLIGCNSSSGSADWNSNFIVWKGNNYVFSDESIDEAQLEEEVGAIDTYSDNETDVKKDQTFSNFFPVGSKLYKLKNVDVKESIAVKDQNTIKKVNFNGEYGK